MRCFGLVFLMACVACSSKRESPVAIGTPDATPPSIAVVAAGPPEPPPPPGVVRCKSSDGKYQVDLHLHGSDPQPRTARVLIDGREPGVGPEGVTTRGHFPPPGALTCSKSDDPWHTGCYVANASDYGYIVNVSLEKQGKRTVELLKNGVASSHLANLACEP